MRVQQQRQQPSSLVYLDRTATLKRGTTAITNVGETVIYAQGGIIFVSGRYATSGSYPISGNWIVSIPALAGQNPQFIGHIGYTNSAGTLIQYAGAILQSNGDVTDLGVLGDITANAVISIHGMVN